MNYVYSFVKDRRWEHDEAPLTEGMLTQCGQCGKPHKNKGYIRMCLPCATELKQGERGEW